MNIKPLQALYSGFEVAEPVGNNAFSFQQRKNKSIYVPPLIQSALSDVQVGSEIVLVK